MANFPLGTDAGNILAHPSYQDSFTINVGPYVRAYNLLARVNTGVTPGDGTGDNLPLAFQKINDNFDITLTVNDVSTAATANKVVLRDSAGNVNANILNAVALNISGTNSTGTVDGGTF